jgi:hypothetical protein
MRSIVKRVLLTSFFFAITTACAGMETIKRALTPRKIDQEIENLEVEIEIKRSCIEGIGNRIDHLRVNFQPILAENLSKEIKKISEEFETARKELEKLNRLKLELTKKN